MEKIIRKLLREALGVPQGITQSAKEFYDALLNEISEIDPNETEKEYDLLVNVPLIIGDYKINQLKFKIEIREFEHVTEPIIASFGFGIGHDIEINKGLRMQNLVKDTPLFLTQIAVHKDDWSFGDIVKLFIEEKNKIISSFSHELKHSYDYYKKPKRSLYHTAMYQSYATTSLGLPPVDKFIHFMYFVHAIEGLVRPSEVATRLEMGGVTRKNFLDFLKKDETYVKLKEISDFSVDKLKKELFNYIPQITDILDHLGEPTDISDEEKVERMLDVIYMTISNIKVSKIRRLMQTDIGEKIFDQLHPDKVKFFERMAERVTKFKSYKEFFEYEEKMFKYVSNKVLSKLYKLYAMTKVDETSILDWDLHHKMNKDHSKEFVNEIKYLKRKR